MYVAQNKLEKPFQLFLLLKLFYPDGKGKLQRIEKYALLNQLPYKDLRTLNTNLKRLEQIGWVKHNTTTGFSNIVSIDRLRQSNHWNSRAGIAIDYKALNHIDAILGFAIYSYLYMTFWRKVRKVKRVRIKGRTYQFYKPFSRSHNQYAPIATTGVKAILGLSLKKASHLKHVASKHGYLTIRKDYDSLPYSYRTIQELIKIESLEPHIRKINGKYQLQLIDLILPQKKLISLKKIK